MLFVSEIKTDMSKVQLDIAKVGHDTDMYKATDEAYNKIADCCKFERSKSDMNMDMKKNMKPDMKMDEKMEDEPMKLRILSLL